MEKPLPAVLDDLRAAGAEVTLIMPDEASRAAIGANPLDPATRGPAADAGRAQGAAHVDLGLSGQTGTGGPTGLGPSATLVERGSVSERPKEHVLKTCEGATSPWVRIPPLPH